MTNKAPQEEIKEATALLKDKKNKLHDISRHPTGCGSKMLGLFEKIGDDLSDKYSKAEDLEKYLSDNAKNISDKNREILIKKVQDYKKLIHDEARLIIVLNAGVEEYVKNGVLNPTGKKITIKQDIGNDAVFQTMDYTALLTLRIQSKASVTEQVKQSINDDIKELKISSPKLSYKINDLKGSSIAELGKALRLPINGDAEHSDALVTISQFQRSPKVLRG